MIVFGVMMDLAVSSLEECNEECEDGESDDWCVKEVIIFL